MVEVMPVDVIPTISEVTGRNIRDETNGSYHTVNEEPLLARLSTSKQCVSTVRCLNANLTAEGQKTF